MEFRTSQSRAPLWAITTYFNPAGYRRRRENYRVFRRHLSVPLLAVELSSDGRLELQPGDADILIQLHGDCIWQKERLLNIGVESLPDRCEAVAWVDCDVIFDTDDWGERTLDALKRFRLVQCFSERHDLADGVEEASIRSAEHRYVSRSVGLAIENGEVDAAKLTTANWRDQDPDPMDRQGHSVEMEVHKSRKVSVGLAWACRLDVLKPHLFYDACIVGGGDRVMLSAAIGAFESARESLLMNQARFAHFLRWAYPFFDRVNRAVGHVEGRLFHQWHGELRWRRYADRDRILADFDPSSDIALDSNGCWRWSSDKPALHRAVRDYFASRREDD